MLGPFFLVYFLSAYAPPQIVPNLTSMQACYQAEAQKKAWYAPADEWAAGFCVEEKWVKDRGLTDAEVIQQMAANVQGAAALQAN